MRTLKNLKAERGLTYRHIAERSGLSKTGVQQIASGATRPNLRSLEKLAKALNVSVHDLIENPYSRE
jgi:transcriptional regulator with XRE-family HTH domain